MSPTRHDRFVKSGLAPPPRVPGKLNTFSSTREHKPNRRNKPYPSRTPHPRGTMPQNERNNYQRSKVYKAKVRARFTHKIDPMDVEHPNAPFESSKSYQTRSRTKRLREEKEQFQRDAQGDVIMTDVPAAMREPFVSMIRTEVPCKQRSCPIKEEHCEGLYLHYGHLAEGPHDFFGVNNPPPNVKEAYAKTQMPGVAMQPDYIMVQGFIECHDPRFDFCQQQNFWLWNYKK